MKLKKEGISVIMRAPGRKSGQHDGDHTTVTTHRDSARYVAHAGSIRGREELAGRRGLPWCGHDPLLRARLRRRRGAVPLEGG